MIANYDGDIHRRAVDSSHRCNHGTKSVIVDYGQNPAALGMMPDPDAVRFALVNAEAA